MNCDVFISYRRDGGDMTAMYIYQALKERGYNVFYDLEVLRAGKFNEALLQAIDSCTDFVLILSPHALDRCRDEGDWVRREIAEALKQKKNIVPVMLNGFQFPEELPEDIDDVRFQNGLSATTEYFTESMDRLCTRYLNSRPVSAESQKSGATSGGKGGRKGLLIGGILGGAAALAVILLVATGALKGKEPPAATEVPAALVPAATEVLVATEAPVTEAPVATEVLAVVTEEPAETEAPASLGETQALKDMELPVLRWDDRGLIDGSQIPSQPALGGPLKREEIDRITLTDGEPGADAWDVSEAGDGSIKAWIETEGEKNTLMISAGGPIRMPQTINGLFQGYTRAETIEWNEQVDFSRVEDSINLFSDSGFTSLDLGGMDFSALRQADGMFQNCQALKELNLTGARMDHLTGMTAMLEGCLSLEQIDLSGLDTSRVQVMTDLFHVCKSLRSLDLSGFDTGRVTMMNSMFDSCERLESVKMDGWDTSRVTSMEAMFASCEKLEDLDVSHFRTGRVESMQNMFLGCSNLLSLDVSGFDTSRVKSFSGMFDGCELLDGLDISGWDTSAAENMAFLFQRCRSLTALDVSGLKTTSVTDMCAMFYGMEQVEELDVSHFDTGSVRVFSNMFTDCQRLKKVDVSHFALDSAEEMEGVFSDCFELTDIGMDPATFGKGNTQFMYSGTIWDPDKQ